MFEWTFNFGNLLTLISFIVGGLSFAYTIRGQLHVQKIQLETIGLRFLCVEAELRKLVDVLINQGKHEERLNAFDQRICAQGRRIDELENRFNRELEAKRNER